MCSLFDRSSYDQKLQDLIKAKEYEIMVRQREAQDIQQKVDRYHQVKSTKLQP